MGAKEIFKPAITVFAFGHVTPESHGGAKAFAKMVG
jgi:hypothetical protein